MKILVTGATGYIGKKFVKHMQKKYDLIALLRKSSDVSQLNNVDCEILRFTKYQEIPNLLKNKKIDGVVHFASYVIGEHNLNDVDKLIGSNIKFGTYLLEACKQLEIGWFINTGTFWQHYQNEEYNPVNLYAATKEAFECIAKYYTETSDLVFTTIKLNDTFGPNDPRPKIMNLWDEYSQTGEELSMTSGEQIIDIVFIEDIINAYGVMIQHLKSSKKMTFQLKSYAVSSKEKVTLKEIAQLFQKVTGKRVNINWGKKPYKEREVMIPWEPTELVPGWKQKYSLQEGIKISYNRDVKENEYNTNVDTRL